MRKGVFAETHHSCLEVESLQPFLPACAASWKPQVSQGHGSLRCKKREEEEVGGSGTEAFGGEGGPGEAGGLAHVCTDTYVRQLAE